MVQQTVTATGYPRRCTGCRVIRPQPRVSVSLCAQEKDLVRLKREAKKEGGFYVEPEAKLAFVIRIRGINDLHPKTRKILQLFRLRQIFNGVFMKVLALQRNLPVCFK